MNRVQKCSKELHAAMTASGLIKPTSSCMVDSVVGISEPEICPRCGKPGPHFVPPSLGEAGFFICDPNASVSSSGDEPEYAPRTCSELSVEICECCAGTGLCEDIDGEQESCMTCNGSGQFSCVPNS